MPGTPYVLDPVTAAFNIGTMNRWLDYNDAWFGRNGAHPSDNLGGILATADYISRCNVAAGKAPLKVRDVLTAMIKAHEIQGITALENNFNGLGIDMCRSVYMPVEPGSHSESAGIEFSGNSRWWVDKPIKAIGVYEVRVQLHPEVSVTVKVNVARSPEEADMQAQGVDVMAQVFEEGRDQGGFTEDYEAHRQEAISAMVARIQRAVEKLARDDGYDLVVNRAVAVGATADLTEKLIRTLDSEAP